MKRTHYQLLLSVLTLIMFALVPMHIAGQTLIPPQTNTVIVALPTTEISTLQTTDTEGEVIRMDGNLMTFKTNTEIKSLALPPTITIRKNGNISTINEIMEGDRVTLTQSQEGQLLIVDIMSKPAVDLSTWLIPIVIAGIVIAVLGGILLKKKNTSHIKTTVE